MSIRLGQVFTTDLVASAFAFIILLNIGLLAVNQVYERQDAFDEERVMQRKTFQAASLLARTQGYPNDWTPSTVEIVGLAGPDHVLQEQKVDDFAGMGYDAAKAAMNLDRYEFFVNITAPTYQREIGQPPTDPSDVAVDRRAAVINTSTLYDQGTLQVILWE